VKIDVYTHLVPPGYLDRLEQLVPSGSLPRFIARMPGLVDVETRLQALDGFEDYVQVLVPAPGLQLGVARRDPATAVELVREHNDELAAITSEHADRFVGFAACLPLHDPDASVFELGRAVRELGALGVQLETMVHGVPLHDPLFDGIFAAAAALGCAVWIHPGRCHDVVNDGVASYALQQIYGSPHDTAVALTRLIVAGHLDRYPNLRVIAHHGGGMIPHFSGRVGPYISRIGPTLDPSYGHAEARLRKPLADYFRMFYADTAMYGAPHAVRCVVDFFGPDRVLFGTDAPSDAVAGTDFIASTIADVEEVLGPSEQEQVFEANALAVLGLPKLVRPG
jgi:aminocarboxymuconate-semialdehyde decarboxylase